jgi:hypothetical protein
VANDLPGSVTSTGSITGLIFTATASASATGGPTPTVSAAASAVNSYNCGLVYYCTGSQTTLTYYLQVVAPASATSSYAALDVFTTASVNATANSAAFDTATAGADAQLGVTQGQLNTLSTLISYSAAAYACQADTADTGYCGSGPYSTTTFKPETTISVYAPELVKISMEVDTDAIVRGNEEAGGAASALASLDPYFQIDPSTPDAAAYSLVFSTGIGNSPAPVPLSASGWLLLSGLGGMLIITRHRSARIPSLAHPSPHH